MIWYCLGCESRIEGGSLHFHCQDALCTALCGHRLRLPKWRIGRPARSDMQGDRAVVPVCADHRSQRRIQVAVRCGRQIVVARPLVAQGPLPASTCETETYKPGHDTLESVPCKSWQVALPLASPFTRKREDRCRSSRFVPWLAPTKGISRRSRTASPG